MALPRVITPWHLWQWLLLEKPGRKSREVSLNRSLSPVCRRVVQLSSLPRCQCGADVKTTGSQPRYQIATPAKRLVGDSGSCSAANHRLPTTTLDAAVSARAHVVNDVSFGYKIGSWTFVHTDERSSLDDIQNFPFPLSFCRFHPNSELYILWYLAGNSYADISGAGYGGKVQDKTLLFLPQQSISLLSTTTVGINIHINNCHVKLSKPWLQMKQRRTIMKGIEWKMATTNDYCLKQGKSCWLRRGRQQRCRGERLHRRRVQQGEHWG